MLKKILNYHEEKTHILLKKPCEKYRAHVFAKVRVADVFEIQRSGISDEQYGFALRAHFDFVITDSIKTPQFVVEFNGPHHKERAQARRDRIKEDLTKRFKLPLLRINANYLTDRYRGMDLLTWAVEYWFLSNIIYEQQEHGNLPQDEPIDPTWFLYLPDRAGSFPMWLSMEPRQKIKKLYEGGEILDPIPSIIVGTDTAGDYRGVSFIRIDDEVGTYVLSAMRNQSFPIIESELLEEILAFEIYEKLKAVLRGQSNATSLKIIDEKIKQFEGKYEWSLRSTYGGAPRATD